MSIEGITVQTALDVLKKILSALGRRKTKKRRKELMSTVITELLKLHPDLNAAEAKIAAIDATGEPPDRELLHAKTMLTSAKGYGRARKATKPKRKKRVAVRKKRVTRKVARKK